MQGGQDWFWTLDKAYKDLGYHTSRADPCVRAKSIDGEHTIANTFNDDVFGTSTTKEGARRAKEELASIYEIKDLKDP